MNTRQPGYGPLRRRGVKNGEADEPVIKNQLLLPQLEDAAKRCCCAAGPLHPAQDPALVDALRRGCCLRLAQQPAKASQRQGKAVSLSSPSMPLPLNTSINSSAYPDFASRGRLGGWAGSFRGVNFLAIRGDGGWGLGLECQQLGPHTSRAIWTAMLLRLRLEPFEIP